MKNRIKHNWGLKLAALFCAAILWMVSTEINDPAEEKQIFGIKVQIVNTGSFTSKGLTYNVLNNSDNVKVTLRGKKSVLDKIADDDVMLRADMSNLTDGNTIPIEWDINNSLANQIGEVVLSKDQVYLSIEEIDKKQLRIEIVQNGKLPEGYVTGTVTTDTNTMTITGPASAVAPVTRAMVDINLDNATTNINMAAGIRLLDAEGKEVTDPEIDKSIENIIVNVPVLPTKEVLIVCEVTGTPQEGFVVNGNVTLSQETVRVAAKETVLNSISEIRIPSSVLNMQGRTENLVENVDIRKYLPADTMLANRAESGIVTVTVEVEAIRHRVLTFSGSDVQLLNNPDSNTWLIEAVPNQSLRLRLAGLQKNLEAIDLSVVIPHFDLSALKDADGNLTEGEHTVNILFLIPEEVIQEANVTVKLRVTKINYEAAMQ